MTCALLDRMGIKPGEKNTVLPPTYLVRRLLRKAHRGSTGASLCTLTAVVKFDCEETPHAVYNEFVAQKLGHILNVPVAAGVLTMVGHGPAFASLHAGAPGVPLPDVGPDRYDKAAAVYQDEVAALVVFDLWIGNDDRGGNFKASLSSEHFRLFAGFDHATALLGIDENPEERIHLLASPEPVVAMHPFFNRRAHAHDIEKWLSRIEAISDEQIRECCEFGTLFRAVAVTWQESLADALIARRSHLRAIVNAKVKLIGD